MFTALLTIMTLWTMMIIITLVTAKYDKKEANFIFIIS